MPEVAVDLGEWSEGTEMHAELSMDDVNAALGLLKGHFEGLNETEDPDGLMDGWTEEGRRLLASDRAMPLDHSTSSTRSRAWATVLRMISTTSS